MALTTLAPDLLWQTHHCMAPVRGVTLPCSTTLARLTDGSLAVITPGPLTDDDSEAIEKLGSVTWLIAPNLYHHLYLRPARERFPDARLLVAPGLEKKRADLPVDGILGEAELPEGLVGYGIRGTPGFAEWVFLHPTSRTLITTDLVFNLGRPSGCLSPLMYGIMGTWNRVACSRLWRSFIKDRPAFDASLGELLELDFDRLVMAHGESIAPNGKTALQEAIAHRWGVRRAAR